MQKKMKRERGFRRSGITLIEVVVASAIAGTLLVSILLAFSQHTRQQKRVIEKRKAIQDVRQFLNVWAAREFSDSWLSDAAKQAGVSLVAEADSFREAGPSRLRSTILQFERRAAGDADALNLEVVRVSAFSTRSAAKANGRPLVWVELLRERQKG